MREVLILGGLRTSIGQTKGQPKDFLPQSLAAYILNQTIAKYT